MTDRGVEKIGNRVAIEIDNKDPGLCNTRHLLEDFDSARVVKVMKRQRLNRVIKRIVAKRQFESAGADRRDFAKVSQLIRGLPALIFHSTPGRRKSDAWRLVSRAHFAGHPQQFA